MVAWIALNTDKQWEIPVYLSLYCVNPAVPMSGICRPMKVGRKCFFNDTLKTFQTVRKETCCYQIHGLFFFINVNVN